MTQSATARRRGASNPNPAAEGLELRQHYCCPAQMRQAARVLRNPKPAELRRLGAKPTPAWAEQADRLERAAECWESERRTAQ